MPHPIYFAFFAFIPFLIANFRYVDSESKILSLFAESSENFESPQTNVLRIRREAPVKIDSNKKNESNNVIIKTTELNDGHKHLMVHWLGEGSNVVVCLARDPPKTTNEKDMLNSSKVYISYDYGDSFVDQTELFKISNNSYSVIEKYYDHPKFNSYLVFTDIQNKLIFTTFNYGRNVKRVQLKFTPSEVHFHEFRPQTFLILDTADIRRSLYITENFGETWTMVERYVESFSWITLDNGDINLIIQRQEPNSMSNILYKHIASLRKTETFASGVKHLFVKEGFIFMTKSSSKNNYDLYISYQLGEIRKCVFDSELNRTNFFIADVSENRAFVAVSHTNTLSHLYVSEDLKTSRGKVHFRLSLEEILCHFPNETWQNTWLHGNAKEPFADLYKVAGLDGIFIASRLIAKPIPYDLGPQHVGSVITFDHGGSWHLLKPPMRDEEGQLNICAFNNNCSLHLGQSFTRLNPDTRSLDILSSKSAPGLIIAMGVLGYSLKGHYGIFVSSDAGLTWTQVLKERYFFSMGNHGGILTAAKFLKSKQETNHLLYSIDEGENWSKAYFSNHSLKLYGLMTEPGENSTVFTIFGSKSDEHKWIIIKVDFKSIFQRNCSTEDYKLWSPSQTEESRKLVPCIMGKQLTYRRRIKHTNCYNGLNLDLPVTWEPCECDVLDFECAFGFLKVGKPHQCIRNKSSPEDPFEIPNWCKPGMFYNRTKGYQRIVGDVCVDGFEDLYLPERIPCPFGEVPEFLLFTKRDKIMRLDLTKEKMEELPIPNLKNVIAIEFDMKNNCVYWSDIASDQIGRLCFNNGSRPEILVSNDLATVEGMAYDWISHHLYFVEGTRNRIELIKTDVSHNGRMRKMIIGPEKLKKPRGIAVHPAAGYFFWTDWDTNAPYVSRANLDGTNIKRLFQKPNVEWPNGITIDYIAERIYWVDAKLDYIGSSDLHGQRFKKIISDKDIMIHPFAIAVYKSELYWDDWQQNSIFSADKDHGISIKQLVRSVTGLMDLKVYGHGLQQNSNACTNSSCSYLCVGAPKQGYSCLCPDGMESKGDKCLCPGGVEPYKNMTCSKIGNTCSNEHFTCNNSLCIPKGWRCDDEDDCGDGSDESNCKIPTCSPDKFVCRDGLCIPHYWRCDYERDCSDGSDELDCPVLNCTSTQFQCGNGRCISKKWKCDGENDCRDGSDERDCNVAEPTSCKPNEFHCKTGGVSCIPLTWRCDEENDCKDGSDELNCTSATCSPEQFSCGGTIKRCINMSWVCDGEIDCTDAADEKNCSSPGPSYNDPFERSNNSACHDWMFLCKNTQCIPLWWKCDRTNDCGDNSDEEGCLYASSTAPPDEKFVTSKPHSHVCPQNYFQCLSGECIERSAICDGDHDCSAGEDELHCEYAQHCGENEYKCRMDGSCIDFNKVCNDYLDCPDGSDESACEHNVPSEAPATPSCHIGSFACDGSYCLPLAMKCDGHKNCRDGSDEADCASNKRVYQVLNMVAKSRGINSTNILLQWKIDQPKVGFMDFLPSISEVGKNKWENKTWNSSEEYLFTGLHPFTNYSMTVYTRYKKNSNDVAEIFPPGIYITATTEEGIPSTPWNLSVTQMDTSNILIKWNPPQYPKGIIQYYIIHVTSIFNEIKTMNNKTSYVISKYTLPENTVSFNVVAFNGKHGSDHSETRIFTFDENAKIGAIKSLIASNKTNNSVVLSWYKLEGAEGYRIQMEVVSNVLFPQLPDIIVNTNSTLVDKLSPGITYNFKVSAFKKNFYGIESAVEVTLNGTALPEIPNMEVKINKDEGTSVKLSWDRPKDPRKVQWVYGIYYGITKDQVLEGSRLNTTQLTVTIANLESCAKFIFMVGVVGPLGVGPLTKKYSIVTTHANKFSEPKNLVVHPNPKKEYEIILEWEAPCYSMEEPIGYMIKVVDMVKNNTSLLSHLPTKEKKVVKELSISPGGIYKFQVSTKIPNAKSTSWVTYTDTSLRPPHLFEVSNLNNGSFLVTWQQQNYSSFIGPHSYEILVSEGNTLKESNANVFEVKEPPFIYTNKSSDVFTFAARLKTSHGYKSILSEKENVKLSKFNYDKSTSDTNEEKSNLASIIIPSCLLIIVLIVIIGYLVIRQRKMQSSFIRFANSHYDSRSGAATFDDNGLDEEEESPQIRGFSDDEPLVIA